MSRDQRISKDGERAKGARTRSIYMLRWHAIACFVALHFAVSLAGTAHEAAPQAPSATAQAQEVHSVAGGSATTSPKTTRLADGSTSDVGQKVEFKKRKVGQRNITIVHEQIGERWDDAGGASLDAALKNDGPAQLKTAMILLASVAGAVILGGASAVVCCWQNREKGHLKSAQKAGGNPYAGQGAKWLQTPV